MKTDRNEAITKNDQFLIICSRGENGVLLRNAQIGILQPSVISTGPRKNKLCFKIQTQLKWKAARPGFYGYYVMKLEFEIWLDTVARCNNT